MTLQCSLHSKKKEEKGDACPAGADVSWVRLGTGDSNVADKGTYYCAVDTYGQILFGGATTLHPSKGNIFIITYINIFTDNTFN